jgi:hypothetical protein
MAVCYDLLENDQPIRQGDIFYPLPYIILDLDAVQTLSMAGLKSSNWNDLMNKVEDYKKEGNDNPTPISIGLVKTWGIVASQDCDASDAPIISLFQIVPFVDVHSCPSSPSGWVSTLTERICKNAKWFYLPKSEELGIDKEMAANFHRVFQIQRIDLENNKNLRRGRLANFAYEHYREAIAQYYRRYPYNEWYSFNKAQLEHYAKNVRKCEIDEIVPKYPMNEK